MNHRRRLEREQGVESGYWSQESQHFLVRYEGGGGIDVGRSVIDNLERAYEAALGQRVPNVLHDAERYIQR